MNRKALTLLLLVGLTLTVSLLRSSPAQAAGDPNEIQYHARVLFDQLTRLKGAVGNPNEVGDPNLRRALTAVLEALDAALEAVDRLVGNPNDRTAQDAVLEAVPDALMLAAEFVENPDTKGIGDPNVGGALEAAEAAYENLARALSDPCMVGVE